MAIKVNEFIIQAKVIEDDDDDSISREEPESEGLSGSVKQEIIDECIDIMKELLEKERARY